MYLNLMYYLTTVMLAVTVGVSFATLPIWWTLFGSILLCLNIVVDYFIFLEENNS